MSPGLDMLEEGEPGDMTFRPRGTATMDLPTTISSPFWMLARSNGYRRLNVRYIAGPVEAMPGNMLAEVGRYSSEAAELAGCSVRNDSIFMELMKVSDEPFVPPIDMPNGAELPTPAMRRRYRAASQPKQQSRFVSLLATSRELLWKSIAGMR